MNRALMTGLLYMVVIMSIHGALAAAADGADAAPTEHTRVLDAADINANLTTGMVDRKEAEVRFSTWPLVVPKKLLRIVPAKERVEFLGSLVLVNGAIAEVQNGVIRKYFKGADYTDTMRIMLPGPDDEDHYFHEKPSRFIRLSALFKEVPAKVSGEFMDNLAFENGHLVSAYVGGLRKRLSPQDLGKVLDMLACDSHKRPTVSATSVCGSGWCTNSSCPAADDIPGRRRGDIVCFSSCLH